jgi:hypothetical protein
MIIGVNTIRNFFLSNATTCPLWTSWSPPPGCNWSVNDFWGWDAHEAQLRCPDDVDGDTWIWSTRRGLNVISTELPRPWSPWESSPSRNNPHGRAGKRTRDLMMSSQKLWPLDHEVGPNTEIYNAVFNMPQLHTPSLCILPNVSYALVVGQSQWLQCLPCLLCSVWVSRWGRRNSWVSGTVVMVTVCYMWISRWGRRNSWVAGTRYNVAKRNWRVALK